MGALRPIQRTLLRDTAYAAVRDAIVLGELPPWDTPVRGALARVGLSRAPVRGALARVGEEGLVETEPQGSARVTSLDPRAVREAVVVVRAMHEPTARAAAYAWCAR
ncbi:GntR family transcriptional regulator [Streptomyces sp. NPDC001820]|uniref:GntR family transcriptional regulator n=1 Tax=Streptomyces sp. NPDC001820 TaxID=3364613 RepID=UPI003698AD0C